MSLDRIVEDVARALIAADGKAVALTGAGISVESGIPDFRSAGGLWERFDPMEYATIDAFRRRPEKVWEMIFSLEELLVRAQPNPAHLALATLERAGLLRGVVTQNIDNLHQRAGSSRVVEFHGNGQRLRCLSCGTMRDAGDTGQPGGEPPRCACGEILKPDVVFFGEQIPNAALTGATEILDGCRVMLVAGTSATVYPFASLPGAAASRGCTLVEVNLEPTPLTSSCDLTLHAPASESLAAVVEMVEELGGGTR